MGSCWSDEKSKLTPPPAHILHDIVRAVLKCYNMVFDSKLHKPLWLVPLLLLFQVSIMFNHV